MKWLLGIRSLMESFNLTQDDISKKLSIPRSSIANSLRILNLPDDVLGLIKENKISLGHAKVILSLEDKNQQTELANVTREKGLSVRQCELMAKAMQKRPKQEKPSKVPQIIKELEIALTEIHGTPVKITFKDGKGSLNITFNSQDSLWNWLIYLKRNKEYFKMVDIKRIRENPEAIIASINSRQSKDYTEEVKAVLKVDEERREVAGKETA